MFTQQIWDMLCSKKMYSELTRTANPEYVCSKNCIPNEIAPQFRNTDVRLEFNNGGGDGGGEYDGRNDDGDDDGGEYDGHTGNYGGEYDGGEYDCRNDDHIGNYGSWNYGGNSDGGNDRKFDLGSRPN